MIALFIFEGQNIHKGCNGHLLWPLAIFSYFAKILMVTLRSNGHSRLRRKTYANCTTQNIEQVFCILNKKTWHGQKPKNLVRTCLALPTLFSDYQPCWKPTAATVWPLESIKCIVTISIQWQNVFYKKQIYFMFVTTTPFYE